MKIEEMKGYGVAMSDFEGSWDPTFKAKLKKTSQRIIFKQISFYQRFQLLYWFLIAKRMAAKLDLSDIRSMGMTNRAFIDQQLEYLSMFWALVKVLNMSRALEIMYRVMDATAEEALLQSSPQKEEIESFGDSLEFFRRYFAILPEVSLKAGCHKMVISENSANCFQFDVHWCVWYELAKKMNIPEACMPNCYADDLAYPEYFRKFGIKYSRSGTLAKGGPCCDFKFEILKSESL